MEKLAALWSSPLLWGLAVLLVVIAFAILRVRQSRAAGASERTPEPEMSEADADLLDSSHVGFAPLISAAQSPLRNDAEATASRNDSAGKRR